MSEQHGEDDFEDDDLRPFLDAGFALPELGPFRDLDEVDERDYLQAGAPLLEAAELAVDSVVVATAQAHRAAGELTPDERLVLACADQPNTLFEITRSSGLSFGLVREIARELLADGLLAVGGDPG